ncbi:MAG: glycosyltransferase [Bacteroidaceae bacterium]|nr:glycosyltransferase [Bacteroidaceae bacterium]
MSRLSVIIPVYNASASLMRCVDSVVLQDISSETERDGEAMKFGADAPNAGVNEGTGGEDTGGALLEIVLVDDGSTDGSGEMCDNIKRQYEDESCRIVVIHKENGGLSSARNAGINASTGELITFVDADDFLGRNTYSKQMEFFECADDVDVVEFPVAKFYNDFLKKEMITFTVDFYEDAISYLYETKAFLHSYAWNKIYRRRVLIPEDNGGTNVAGGFFADGKTFEDIHALPKWLSRARRIVTYDGGCYFYTLSPDGICQKSGAQQYKDHLDGLKNLVEWIPEQKRKGGAYAKLFASMLNVRKDYCMATGGKYPINVSLSWQCLLSAIGHVSKPELLKLLAYKL